MDRFKDARAAREWVTRHTPGWVIRFAAGSRRRGWSLVGWMRANLHIGPARGLLRVPPSAREFAGWGGGAISTNGQRIQQPRNPPLWHSGSLHGCFPRKGAFAEKTPRSLSLRDGVVIGSQGLVLNTQTQLVECVCPEIGASGWAHPVFRSTEGSGLTRLAGCWAVVSTARADNYYHWVFDALPKLALYSTFHFDGVIAPATMGFQRDSLRMAGCRRVVALDRRCRFIAEELLVASPPGVSGNPSPWMIQFLRDTFGISGPRSGNRYLYVSRQGSRRSVTNEEDVRTFLVARGFEIIQPGSLGFAEQVRLFSEAAVVVGPHGAGLTNLAFCPPGTRVVECFHPNYVNLCYWALCQAAGHHYAAVAAPRSGSAGLPGRLPIEVPLVDLGKALQALGV